MKYNLYVKYVVNLMLNVDVIKRICVMASNYILMVNVFYHFLHEDWQVLAFMKFKAVKLL